MDFSKDKEMLAYRLKCCGIYFEGADVPLKLLDEYNRITIRPSIIFAISEPRYSEKEIAELKGKFSNR